MQQNNINQAYAEYYRLFNQGVKLFKLQNDLQAIKQFQYSLEDVPMGFASYLNLSVLFLKMKKIQQSLKNCQFAIWIRPYESAAYYNRCMIHLQSKELIKANSDIQCALSCQYLKKYQENIEIKHLDIALKFCPNNLQALKQRIIHKKLLQKSFNFKQFSPSSVFRTSYDQTVQQDQKIYKNYQKNYQLTTIQIEQKKKFKKEKQQLLLNIGQYSPFFQLQSSYQNQKNFGKNQDLLLKQLKQKILIFLQLIKGQEKKSQKAKENLNFKQDNNQKIESIKQYINLSTISKNKKNKNRRNQIQAQMQMQKNKQNMSNKENIIPQKTIKIRKLSFNPQSLKFIKNKECIFEDSNISIYDYHHQTENKQAQMQNSIKKYKKQRKLQKQLKIKNCPLIQSISLIPHEESSNDKQNNSTFCNDMYLSLTKKDCHYINQQNMSKSTVSMIKNYTPQKVTDRTFLNISNSLHKISCSKCTVDLQKQEERNLKIQIYLTQIYHFQESFSTLFPYCLIIYKNQVFKTQVSKTTFPSWKDQIFISYKAQIQDNKECNSQKNLRIQLWNKQRHGQDKIIGSADCQIKQGKRKVILSHRGRQSAYMYINSTKI